MAKTRRETQITCIRSKKGGITTDPTGIKRVIKESKFKSQADCSLQAGRLRTPPVVQVGIVSDPVLVQIAHIFTPHVQVFLFLYATFFFKILFIYS